MNDFEYDCLQRKRLANQAIHRKGGSKSKKCTLSTDHMTPKQWKERCGAIVSVRMNEPISWAGFKQISKPTQEEYLKGLMTEYGVNCLNLADMFQVSGATLHKYIKDNDLGVKFQRGHVMQESQRGRWERFMSGCSPTEDSPCVQQDEEVQQFETAASDEPGASKKFLLDQFSLRFSGAIDIAHIANSLTQILGGNAVGEVEIVCRLANEN